MIAKQVKDQDCVKIEHSTYHEKNISTSLDHCQTKNIHVLRTEK